MSVLYLISGKIAAGLSQPTESGCPPGRAVIHLQHGKAQSANRCLGRDEGVRRRRFLLDALSAWPGLPASTPWTGCAGEFKASLDNPGHAFGIVPAVATQRR